MSNKISPPPWLKRQTSHNSEIKPLTDFLPRIEENYSAHEDTQTEIKTLKDVLIQNNWQQKLSNSLKSQEKRNTTSPNNNHEEKTIIKEKESIQTTTDTFVTNDDEISKKNNNTKESVPVSEESHLTKNKNDNNINKLNNKTAKKEESDKECNQNLPLSDIQHLIRQELSTDIGEILKQEAEKIFEKEKQRAWDIVEKELTKTREKFIQHIKKLEETSKELTNFLDDNYIKLLEILVQKITYKELSISKDAIKTIVQKSLEVLKGEKGITVKISKQDYEYLKQHESKWLEDIQSNESFQIQIDEELQLGDCVIESSLGRIDNTLTNRIEQVLEALYDGAKTTD